MRPSPTTPTGSIAASQLATGLITGVKMNTGAIRQFLVTGRNGAGACSTGASGLKVGDKVIGVLNVTDEAEAKADFESTVTVADQLQQSSGSNYSAKKFWVTVFVCS